MNSFKRAIIFTIFLLLFKGNAALWGQTDRITPEKDRSYFLEVSMLQETESENQMLAQNISLELSCTMNFTLREQLENSLYMFDVSYSGLQLSFFSPQLEYYINSNQKEFRFIREYLTQLEKVTFPATLSSHGQCLQVSGIDSAIAAIQIESKTNSKQRQLFIKTIKEAYGNKAFKSLVNLALHIYPTSDEVKNGINTYIFFNAREIPLRENFFVQPTSNEMQRIQGIGVIPEKIDTLNWNDLTLISSLKGNQTYDFLVYRESGWVKEGISKQKIHSVSKIHGHEELPEGLKIPSYTVTDYTFRGGVSEAEKEKRKRGSRNE